MSDNLLLLTLAPCLPQALAERRKGAGGVKLCVNAGSEADGSFPWTQVKHCTPLKLGFWSGNQLLRRTISQSFLSRVRMADRSERLGLVQKMSSGDGGALRGEGLPRTIRFPKNGCTLVSWTGPGGGKRSNASPQCHAFLSEFGPFCVSL